MSDMQAVILNRLLSARFLLENSGRHLNRHSDSRAVAHGVLMAHDAAELTLGAIAEELQLSLAEKVTFPELTKAINDKFIVLHAANTSKFPSGLSGQLYLNKLNKVRVAFKHHGELPNVGSWFEVMDTVTNYLDEACKAIFGIAVTEIDTTYLIDDQKIFKLIEGAKQDRINGDYKCALEKLAVALYRTNSVSRMWINPGEPDSELALALSGYGIEPSSFVLLQQLLPCIEFHKVEWKLHKTGHPMNWNEQNVNFSIEAVVQIVLRLQHAKPGMHLWKFYDVYWDVLTITAENPEVRKGFSPMYGLGDTTTTVVSGFLVGDKIFGKICACADGDGEYRDEDLDLNEAEWLRIERPHADKHELSDNDFLVIQRKDVTISYEEAPESHYSIAAEITPVEAAKFLESLVDIELKDCEITK